MESRFFFIDPLIYDAENLIRLKFQQISFLRYNLHRVNIAAWYQTGNKSLPDMIMKISDAFDHH